MNVQASLDDQAVSSTDDTPPARGAMRLWIYGLGIAAICAVFAWRYPLRGNSEELLDIGKLADYRIRPFVGFIAGMIGLFTLYILAIVESRRVDPARGRVILFVCGLLQVAGMVWMYPVSAIDAFIYSTRSRLFTEYDANPLVAFPRDYPDDPFMRFSSQEWGDDVSPYGPLWNLIAAPVTLVSGDRIGIAVAGFKILAAVAAIAGAWLIVRTVRISRPGDAVAAGVLYLWNPLILWEGVGNGHNDLVMMALVLAALLAWTTRKDTLVIPLLVTAATIKYVPLLILPIAALALWRRAPSWRGRWKIAAWSAIWSALALIVAFFPFYDVNAVRQSVASQGDFYLTSLAAMAINLFQERYAVEDIKQWATWIGYSLLGATLLWQAARVIRDPTRLPRAMFEVMFVYLLAASWTFRGWYLIWVVGLAALTPIGWPAARAVAWTAGAMAVYGLFIWVWHWWQADFGTILNVAVPIIMAPALLLSVAQIAIHLGSSWVHKPFARTSPPGHDPVER